MPTNLGRKTGYRTLMPWITRAQLPLGRVRPSPFPELRNAVTTGNLKGVPKAAESIPTVAGATNVNTRINVRGQLPAGRGRFGDGVTGATAIERGSTLVTRDKKLGEAVEKLGGKVKRPEDIR